jgi:hypothetical protein
MSQWKSDDSAANSVLWGGTEFNLAPNTTNQTNLFGNVTPSAIVSGMTVGQFGVSAAEMAGNSGVGYVTVTAQGSGATVRPTVTLSGNATATAVGAVVTAAVGANKGTAYVVGDYLAVAGGTGTAANLQVANIGTVLSQTSASFNNTGANGTFAAGADYDVADTITLNDGSVVTVLTVSSNAVATFNVSTRSVGGSNTNNPTLTQNTTSGAGTGFTLTLGNNNQSVVSLTVVAQGAYTVLPTLTNNNLTGGSGSSVQGNLSIGVGNTVTITAAGSNYTANATVTFGGTGLTGATGTSALYRQGGGAAHAGWVLRKVGSGGRAGRVQYETLVAMGSMTSDASDDESLPE